MSSIKWNVSKLGFFLEIHLAKFRVWVYLIFTTPYPPNQSTISLLILSLFHSIILVSALYLKIGQRKGFGRWKGVRGMVTQIYSHKSTLSGMPKINFQPTLELLGVVLVVYTNIGDQLLSKLGDCYFLFILGRAEHYWLYNIWLIPSLMFSLIFSKHS